MMIIKTEERKINRSKGLKLSMVRIKPNYNLNIA